MFVIERWKNGNGPEFLPVSACTHEEVQVSVLWLQNRVGVRLLGFRLGQEPCHSGRHQLAGAEAR